MHRHCCVPGCKINYWSELKSTSFRSVPTFPKNNKFKSKWLAALPREDWSTSKESLVCSSRLRISKILTSETLFLECH
nr:unnamed protein product [Callosobruchus analis]